jgi:hypothetical protein
MENQVSNLKCKFSNAVHKLLEPGINLKRSDRWKTAKTYTDKEKIEMFDMLIAMHEINSEEIGNALYKRRKCKRVQNARLERGYTAKQKTSKEEYESMLQTH